jgi:hypothetical protein
VQPFETEGCLAFAGANPECRRKHRIDVGVLQHQRATREVGIQVELEVLCEPAAQVRAHTTDQEHVVHGFVRVVYREPAVGVHQRANLQAEVPFLTLDEEPVAPAGGDRRRCRRRVLLRR